MPATAVRFSSNINLVGLVRVNVKAMKLQKFYRCSVMLTVICDYIPQVLVSF